MSTEPRAHAERYKNKEKEEKEKNTLKLMALLSRHLGQNVRPTFVRPTVCTGGVKALFCLIRDLTSLIKKNRVKTKKNKHKTELPVVKFVNKPRKKRCNG